MLRLNGVLHFRKGLLDSGMLNELWGALDQGGRLSLISGPCAIESEELCLEVGEFLRQECAALGVTYIFKASYDKANRSSGASFRGPDVPAEGDHQTRAAGGCAVQG